MGISAVEEFHRARCPFARKLPLRRFALLHRDNVPDNDEIARRDLAAAIHQGEFQLLTFSQTF